jgi:diaminopimelate epimerase
VDKQVDSIYHLTKIQAITMRIPIMPEKINFQKMHGLGNDFMVINAIDQKLPAHFPITQLANRHLGVGFDQLLILTPSKKADFACQIFNADGSEAEQCGNGMRCIGRFIREERLSSKESVTIETKGSIAKLAIHTLDSIEVNMGKPVISPSVELNINDQAFQLNIVSMGNPHAILLVPNVENFPVKILGKAISENKAFPEGTNVGFMQIIDRRYVKLRTYERGVGETFACGSNACAAVVSGVHIQFLDPKVVVELTFGKLEIQWAEGEDVIMRGPGEKVFAGVIEI